jgi:PBP1b-binding outer membrane lipoprotein LpoB
MKKKSGVNLIRYLLLLGVMSFFTSCSQTMDTQATQSKENAMNLAYKTEKESLEIPPIDAAAPMNFETASFGLG